MNNHKSFSLMKSLVPIQDLNVGILRKLLVDFGCQNELPPMGTLGDDENQGEKEVLLKVFEAYFQRERLHQKALFDGRLNLQSPEILSRRLVLAKLIGNKSGRKYMIDKH